MFRFLADDPESTQRWFSQPAAAGLIAQESCLLGDLLSRMSGYRGVSLASWPIEDSVVARAGTLRHWQLGVGARTDKVDVQWDGLRLPLASSSVDALVLMHGLEVVSQPHALIRECARVLSDRGQLAVFCFNPLSWWALRQSMPTGRAERFTPCCVPPRAARLIDWLRVLDIETDECWRYGPGYPLFGRPWRAQGDASWLGCIAWQAPGYALLARRRVSCRPSSGKRERVAAKSARSGLAQPAGRQITWRR